MTRFLVTRLGWSVLVLWFVVSATFAITFAIPAEPARTLVGPHGNPETIARVKKELCLDQPFWVQYGCYVGRLARGDLGTSFRTRREVTDILASRLWPTAQLALATLFLQILLGVPLGIVAALRRNRAADVAANVTALLGQSAPTFFLGPLFMYLFGYRLGWFPVSGYGEGGFWDRLHHLFLPALTLAVVGAATYTRLVRGEMIEVLQEDYVRTARAKGLGSARVVLKHALRNALGPVVTLMGLDLGYFMGGAIVTEHIFAWPGIGREVLQAVLDMDLPVILGVVLVAACAIVVANLIVDLVYAGLDPRVRLGKESP
jgi:peptide/nickel transport system permease protein